MTFLSLKKIAIIIIIIPILMISPNLGTLGLLKKSYFEIKEMIITSVYNVINKILSLDCNYFVDVDISLVILAFL